MTTAHQLIVAIMITGLPLLAQGNNAVQQGALVGGVCNVTGGSLNVTVAGQPMARVGDPIQCPAGATCPDGNTPITGTIANGSSSVFVNGVPAAVSGVSEVADACIPLTGIGGWPFVEIAP